MIGVVELGPDEWRVWREIRLEALRDAPEAFGSTSADWEDADEARWRARLADVPLHAFARLDDLPAGVVSATAPDGSGQVELISMWVAPFARGRAVGGALIDYALRWVTDRHPSARIALQVRKHNAPAIRLYERHGFVLAGENPEDELEFTMRWHGVI
ncbi:N-acetyltransferase [Allobranchiibius sp. GilTou73]|uniref:GNAT family N-acetyltransferase n=1 Tax=Allobranchiibius sp. GilTou73 TaxID=2904523 RepID=UPI001F263076|nr:GNAT family N-acetyltransferase [Allobranchiibius sp. GilTou73]UIJ35103.1 GNAT family N-acetyltransferase [Allobranchiibius sp. GilTou73]